MFNQKNSTAIIFVTAAILSLAVLMTVNLIFRLQIGKINGLLNQIRRQQFNQQVLIKRGTDPLISQGVKPLQQVLTKPLNNPDDPWRGSATAKVTIIEFSDFQCGYCAKVQKTLHQLATAYPRQLKFVWKDFPLINLYPKTLDAAIAARCAQQQGKFWEYHDLLFTHQDSLSINNYRQWAKQLDLDQKQFEQCLNNNQKVFNLIKNDFQEATKLGISGTPYFYINDQEVLGSASFEDFKKIIDIELEK